jgi:hypothetical protein
MKMSLENLLKINKLQTHHPSRESVQRLLQAAARNIEDARVAAISGETRFDAAYKCIMQCAMVALWANGYRTSSSQPGHHQTAIQTLPITIALDQSTVIVLVPCASNGISTITRATRSANRRSPSASNRRSNYTGQ